MMRKRILTLLVVMALAAPMGFAQAKLPRSQSQNAAPQHDVQPRSTAPVERPAARAPEAQVPDTRVPTETMDLTAVSQPTAIQSTPSPAQGDWKPMAIAIVTAVIVLLAVTAAALQMQKMTKKILAALPRNDDGRHDRDRVMKELAVVKNDIRTQIGALKATADEIPTQVERRIQKMLERRALEQRAPEPVRAPANPTAHTRSFETPEPSRTFIDAAAQLLGIANRIVQQTPATLDAFRTSTREFVKQVIPWPNAVDGTPSAFIVDDGESYYAIPNVIKPARLPQEWFNRSEFGVNDEIQRIVSLPRLRRRGNDYEVSVPGVFSR